MVKKGGDGGVIRKIAELVAEKKLTEISDIQDHSDRNGMRVVIELKRDANPKVVLNKLYKHTPMQTTFGVNMVSLVENVPRLLGLKDVIKFYVRHQREVIVRRAKHELKGLERRVHVLEGLLIALDHIDAIIALIRVLARSRLGAHRPDGALRALLRPGAGHPRAPPAAADRPGGRHAAQRARGQDGAHPRAQGAARQRGHGPRADQDRARRGVRALRRRAAHEDRAVRGRHRHRGPDRRPADGHLDHEHGLHQVPAARDLPGPAPRRRRDHRHGHEGRGLHRAPVRVLDPRLPAVLHEPRQGLPVQGLRPAGDVADVEGPLPRQRAAAARGRAGAVGAGDAGLLRGPVHHVRHPQRHGEEDGVPALQHADPRRRHHRHQHPRRRRARRRAPGGRGRRDPDRLPRRPRGPLQGVRRPRDGPRHQRRPRHGRRPTRTTTCWRWTSPGPVRTCWS